MVEGRVRESKYGGNITLQVDGANKVTVLNNGEPIDC